jgi:hypothetical protein
MFKAKSTRLAQGAWPRTPLGGTPHHFIDAPGAIYKPKRVAIEVVDNEIAQTISNIRGASNCAIKTKLGRMRIRMISDRAVETNVTIRNRPCTS